MKLFLVRHGEYVPESVNAEKPLSDNGKIQIENVGKQLKNNDYRVDEIFHSGKLRAKETAEILAKYVLAEGEIQQKDGLNPGDDAKQWAERLPAINNNLMLVGHLPFMESLSGLLLENDEYKTPVRFNQGTVTVLTKDQTNKWSIEMIFS